MGRDFDPDRWDEFRQQVLTAVKEALDDVEDVAWTAHAYNGDFDGRIIIDGSSQITRDLTVRGVMLAHPPDQQKDA